MDEETILDEETSSLNIRPIEIRSHICGIAIKEDTIAFTEEETSIFTEEDAKSRRNFRSKPFDEIFRILFDGLGLPT